MTRLFIDLVPYETGLIKLDKKYSHYVKHVLRYSERDELIVFDGTGKEYTCRVSSIEGGVTLLVESVAESGIKPRTNIVLMQGLLKGRKMDVVLRKAVEMGIKTVIPVFTDRSQIRKTSKLSRWRTIAYEASRQCGRSDVMDIRDVAALIDAVSYVLSEYPEALKIVFYESSDVSLRTLEDAIKGSEDIIIFIGPEGGFSPYEIGFLRNEGFHAAGLGKVIMRAETVPLVSAGIIQYIAGQFD